MFQGFINPRSKLTELAQQEVVWSALVIGAGGFYLRTLPLSERLLPAHIFDVTFIFFNVISALVYLGIISLLIQGAFYLCGHSTKSKFRTIYFCWGWTEIPKLILILGVFYLNFFIPGFLVNILLNWVLLIAAVCVLVIFLLWYLFLKLQALKVCYEIGGKKLIYPVLLVVLFYGGFNILLLSTLEKAAWVKLTDLKPMMPTLDFKLGGETPLINPYIRIPVLPAESRGFEFRRGDVVTYALSSAKNHLPFPENLFSKPRHVGRIVGLPGETVEIKKAWVKIDGKPLQEPYITFSQLWDHPPTQVSGHQFFVLGDNRLMTLNKYPGGVIDQDNIDGLYTASGVIMCKFFEPKKEEPKASEFKEEESFQQPHSEEEPETHEALEDTPSPVEE